MSGKPGIAKILWALVVVGVVLFLVHAAKNPATNLPLRAWQSYLVNWIFWSGIAMGGVVFAAILDVTNSSWGRPIKRVAEGFAAFLPVSFALYVLYFPGIEFVYPWVEFPVPGNEKWLSQGAVYIRDIIALFVLYGVSLLYVYRSIRPDLAASRDANSLSRAISKNWKSDAEEVETGLKCRRILAPAVIIIYAFAFSLLAFDLVMSLVPTWTSTLFGAYIFIVNIFGAIAAVTLTAIFLKRATGLELQLGEAQYHDLGKLLLGFCLLSLDFFWSQFLVIWYGNIPEETGFILLRAYSPTWRVISWSVLIGCFIAPFFLLLRKSMKVNPTRLGAVAALIVIMVWFERFVLIAPSVWKSPTLPLGPLEFFVTAAFGSLFALSFVWLIKQIPHTPVSDPIFSKSFGDKIRKGENPQ